MYLFFFIILFIKCILNLLFYTLSLFISRSASLHNVINKGGRQYMYNACTLLFIYICATHKASHIIYRVCAHTLYILCIIYMYTTSLHHLYGTCTSQTELKSKQKEITQVSLALYHQVRVHQTCHPNWS